MIIEKTKPIISQIEEMVKDIPGWSPIDQLYTLFQLVVHTSHLEGNIIEIGSWCGRSASVIGTALQLIGKGKLICVDLFPEKNDWKENADGTYSLSVTLNGKEYSGYQEQVVWKEPFLNAIAPIYKKYNSVFDVFDKSIKLNNLSDFVDSFKGDSRLYFSDSKNLKPCRLAFLDGDHSYSAVYEDIKNIEKVLVSGGWVCFDDAFSHFDGVNRAIQDLIIDNEKYDYSQQMTRKFFIARKK